MDLREVSHEVEMWIELAQDHVQRWALALVMLSLL